MRNNSATPGADTNYLQYTGEDHVVLGGTNPGNAANPSGNDIIISSIGDDTLYGDGGNDRLEGGDGDDIIFGGAGDDIITDTGRRRQHSGRRRQRRYPCRQRPQPDPRRLWQ